MEVKVLSGHQSQGRSQGWKHLCGGPWLEMGAKATKGLKQT